MSTSPPHPIERQKHQQQPGQPPHDLTMQPPVNAEAPKDADAADETPANPAVSAHVAAKKLRRRKPHHKSQLGCLNCKKRKIKCQENLPACSNCLRKGIDCHYPNGNSFIPVEWQPQEISVSNPHSIVNLNWNNLSFSLTDMRLLHHFIIAAHPVMPGGNEAMWVGNVPASAHHHPHLMHALLSFSAHSMESSDPDGFKALAVRHRDMAIRGLNHAMASFSLDTCPSWDRDALLATVYLLGFHASYLVDGLSEWFVAARSAGFLVKQINDGGGKTSWKNLNFEDTIRMKLAKCSIQEKPPLDTSITTALAPIVTELREVCTRPEEQGMLDGLAEVAAALENDHLQAYLNETKFWEQLCLMPPEQFLHFVSQDNLKAQQITGHWLATFLLLLQYYGVDVADLYMAKCMRNMRAWIENIDKFLRAEDNLPPWNADVSLMTIEPTAYSMHESEHDEQNVYIKAERSSSVASNSSHGSRFHNEVAMKWPMRVLEYLDDMKAKGKNMPPRLEKAVKVESPTVPVVPVGAAGG